MTMTTTNSTKTKPVALTSIHHHPNCGSCDWKPKGEIALAICVHGIQCEVRRLAMSTKTETTFVHTVVEHVYTISHSWLHWGK